MSKIVASAERFENISDDLDVEDIVSPVGATNYKVTSSFLIIS